MTWWHRLIKRDQMEQQLDAELRFHFDSAVAENISAGMSEQEARRNARLQFGGIDQVKEECRDARGTRWFESFFQDMRYGLRMLGKSKGLTAILTLTLASGIGANTAIFSLVNQVLLHPPGISHPERLVVVPAKSKTYTDVNTSAQAFADVRDSRQVFEHTAAQEFLGLNYNDDTGPVRLTAAAVSVEWFDVFGASPESGRVFVPEEDHPGANRVVVLSYATWVRLFGADSAVVGRTIELSQQPYKVIGVMGPAFQQPQAAEVWIPLALPSEEFNPARRCCGTLHVVARMKSGVHLAQAKAWLKVLTDRARGEGIPAATLLKNSDWSIYGVALIDHDSGDTKTALFVLLGAVGIVLIIACANLSGLMLAKTSARGHEIAMRAALGASRRRLMRQLLSESLLLSIAGAILGLALAHSGVKLLLRLAPEGAVAGNDAPLDVYVLLFTGLAAIVAGMVSGMAPAWQLSKVDAVDAAKVAGAALKGGGGHTTADATRQRLRSALVVLETGLAVVLLVAAGLFLQALKALENLNPGFDSRGVMTASFALPPKQYPDGITQGAFYRAVLERLANTKGVTSAGISLGLPFSGWVWGSGFEIEGRPQAPGEPFLEGARQLVTPDYFKTLKIPLRRGRFLTEQDRLGSQPVAVIDEKLARQYWPNEDPFGKRISLNSGRSWTPIVGIVGHTMTNLTADFNLGVVYLSVYQRSQPLPFPPVGWIVARTDGSSGNVAAAIRDAVRLTDKNQPLDKLRALDDLVASSLATRRFVMQLLQFFAATALFMAALGLYGVITFSVARRTREIGIQMAVGARSSQVRNMVVFQGMRLALIGVAIGIVAALGLTRLLASSLFGVQPRDPLTFVVVPVVLAAVALLACYLPARRATRINPMEALRWE